MTESMRKIIYYENILEFKRNTQSQINLREVNNWKLCRTCLAETNDTDIADMEKMCFMDVMEGQFLTVQEMLTKVTASQLHKGLPTSMCKDCMRKITTLYFFSIQVKKAEEVLIKLSEQLKITDKVEESPTVVNELEITSDSADQMHDEKSNVDENCTSTTLIEEHELHLDSNDQIFQDNADEVCISTNEVDDGKNSPKEGENINETQFSDENQTVSNKTLMKSDEDHLERIDVRMDITSASEECQDDLDDDFAIAEDTVDEVYLIENDDEQLEYKCSTSKITVSDEETEEEFIFIETTTEDMGTSYELGQPRAKKKLQQKTHKHKQPRVTKPLLEKIKCGVCEMTFNRQFDLVSHVKQKHPNSKAFQCRDCGALFSHTQSLSRHMNTHKPKIYKNACEYCSKSFLRPDDLRRHIRVHTGERPYSCGVCEKSFKQQGEMRQHMIIHLEQKQYKCAECDRAFASRNSLYLHKKAHSTSRDQLTSSPYAKTYKNKKDQLYREQQMEGKEKNITAIWLST